MRGPAQQWEVIHSSSSGGLGVASACSTDAAQISICLFSLTPSLLVLKGNADVHITSIITPKANEMRASEACDVDKSGGVGAPTERLLVLYCNYCPQNIHVRQILTAYI